MKQYLILIAFIIIIFSGCSPDDPPPTPSASSLRTRLVFTVNGQTDSIIGSLTDSTTGTEIRKVYTQYMGQLYPYFSLWSIDKNSNGAVKYKIGLNIYSNNSLATGIYTFNINSGLPKPPGYGSISECAFDAFGIPSYYSTNSQGDESEIIITSIHNGYADGTFRGIVSNASGPCNCPPLNITNGLFQNVKIID